MATQTPEQLQQIISGYQPNLAQPVLFTIPGEPGQQGNTIDVNGLTEQAVDQSIQQYGGHGPLIGRKSYLQALREKDAVDNPAVDPLKQQLDEYQAENEGLWNKYTDSAVNRFNEEIGRKRSKLMSDEIASGRGGSPVSNYTTGEFDRNVGLSLSGMLGDISKQQAMGQVDLAKTVENIRNSMTQFDKTQELDKNQFQAKLNDANANRLLSQDLARAKMQHETDINTPDDFTKWTGRAKTGLDIFSQMFPMSASASGEGGRGGKSSGRPVPPEVEKALMSMALA